MVFRVQTNCIEEINEVIHILENPFDVDYYGIQQEYVRRIHVRYRNEGNGFCGAWPTPMYETGDLMDSYEFINNGLYTMHYAEYLEEMYGDIFGFNEIETQMFERVLANMLNG